MRQRSDPRSLLATIVFLALSTLARPSQAHQTSVVYLDATVDGRVVELEARIGAEDLGEPVGRSPLLPPSRAQARAGASLAAQYVAERIRVTNGGAVCEPRAGDGAVEERPAEGSFALAVAVRYTCARQIDDLQIRYDLFFDLDPRHQALAQIRAFGGSRQAVFRADARTVRMQGRASLFAQFGDYLLLGIEHIFTGYDHIAFLFGLLVVAGGLGARRGARYALGVVTAFTAAHSVTLVASALGWVHLPSRLVESAIALSIVYVAVENVRRAEPRGRWALAFGFGLLHGFGFAGALGELGLPARGLVPSLLAFNAGVEIGQLAVVLVALPALLALGGSRVGPRQALLVGVLATGAYLLLGRFGVPRATLATVVFGGAVMLLLAARRFGYARGVRVGGSLVIAALGALWLGERLAGRIWLDGALG